jgi:hypothetical protein
MILLWVYGCTGVLVYGCTGVWVYRCRQYICVWDNFQMHRDNLLWWDSGSSAAVARPSATKNGCPPFALRPSEASLDSLHSGR